MNCFVCSSAMCSCKYCLDDFSTWQMSHLYFLFWLLSNCLQFSCSCLVQSFLVVKGSWHLKHQNLWTPFKVFPHRTLTSPLEVWNVAACAGNWTCCTPAAANCLTSCCCCCEETTGWVVDDETEGWAVLGVDHMGCCCLGVSPGIVLDNW